MAIESAQVVVTTAATKLSTAAVQHSEDGPTQTVAVQPVGGSVYIGGSNVTTANGFLVTAGQTASLDLAYGEELYGVAATGTVTVHAIRTGV